MSGIDQSLMYSGIEFVPCATPGIRVVDKLDLHVFSCVFGLKIKIHKLNYKGQD